MGEERQSLFPHCQNTVFARNFGFKKKVVSLLHLHNTVQAWILSAKFFSAKCQNLEKHLDNLKVADSSDRVIKAVYIDGSLGDLMQSGSCACLHTPVSSTYSCIWSYVADIFNFAFHFFMIWVKMWVHHRILHVTAGCKEYL